MKLYLAEKGLSNSIIYTQLYIPLNYLAREGDNILLLAPSGFINYVKTSEVQTHYYSGWKDKLLFLFRNRKLINNIYTRSIFEFYVIFLLKLFFQFKFKIRYDYRGLISEESYLRNNSLVRKILLSKLETGILHRADSVSTVSEKFKEYLNKIYNKHNIVVTPCCTSNVILKIKPKSQILKFVYVGSLGKWQNFDKMLVYYKNIHRLIPNTELTIITNEKHSANRMCLDMDVEANIFSVNNSEIKNLLPQYDFGFLLRDNILLNNVASPVKFLEYTSCGVIPIISNGVGDYSDIVKDLKIGYVVEDNLTISVDNVLCLLNDPNIYGNLYNFSLKYTWDHHYFKFKM